MDTNQLIALAGLVGAAAGTLAGIAMPFLLQTNAPVRALAVAGADYMEAITEAVAFAESAGMLRPIPGADKLAIAIRQMDAWLDAAGIYGDARKVTAQRIMADIELVRAQLFPSHKAAA